VDATPCLTLDTGEWEDGESVELNEIDTPTDPDSLCYGKRTWQGTTACGDLLTICCDSDDDVHNDDGTVEMRWQVWWCNETNQQSYENVDCEDNAFELGTSTFDAMSGGSDCCCSLGQFTLSIRDTAWS